MRPARRRGECRPRRDVHDGPLPAGGGHAPRRGRRAEERPLQVHPEEPVPVGFRHVEKGHAREDRGVVHENIDAAETVGGRHETLDLLRPRNVGLHRYRVRACRLHRRGHDGGGLLVIQIIDHDRSACLGRSQRNGGPDALLRARDDGNPACKNGHRSLPIPDRVPPGRPGSSRGAPARLPRRKAWRCRAHCSNRRWCRDDRRCRPRAFYDSRRPALQGAVLSLPRREATGVAGEASGAIPRASMTTLRDLRNGPGASPKARRNHRFRWALSAKPHSWATRVTVRVVFIRSHLLCWRRKSRQSSAAVMPQ